MPAPLTSGKARLTALAAVALLLSSPSARQTRGETNDLWFPIGEELHYRLYWGIIPVGSARFVTAETVEDGRRLIHLKGTARTGKVVSMIYPINDRVESFVDPETFLPIRYIQHLREGRSRRNDSIVFDHAEGNAYWKDDETGETNTIPIAADTRDVLCLTYYMRSKGYEVDQKESFQVLVDNKLYDLTLTGLSYQSVKTPEGRVRCLKIEPEAKFGEIFVRKGRVWIWFSADERRLCVKMAAKIPVASVNGVLIHTVTPEVATDAQAAD